MDDLNSVISSILGDPQKMEQLRNVAQSLGMAPGDAPAAPQSPPPAQPDMMSMLGNLMAGMNANAGGGAAQSPPAGAQTPPASAGGAPPINMGALSALAGLFGGMNGGGNDKNVQLLRALQPHISTARAGRIDDAMRIMQLISAWPAIRDSGLLGNIGNLFTGGGHR